MEFLNEALEHVDSIPHPHVGMTFETLEEAWNFWVGYGGTMGFHVRIHSKNVNKKGEITSRGFVCGNEGHRTADKRNREVKKPRAETRTDCPVGLFLSLCRQTNKYVVYRFGGDHNHPLQPPEAVSLMPSQWKISEPYGVIIDLADDSGIRPKEAYELMGREAGGSLNLPFTKRDHLNYLRDKHKRNLTFGEAESMMRYFSNRT